MSPPLTLALVVFSALTICLLLVDLVRGRRRFAAVGLALLVAFLAILHLSTGFPGSSAGRMAFGDTFPVVTAIGLMFGGVILGIIAQYLWSKPVAFSWLEFLRPLVVSPIVLLPLIGSLEGGGPAPLQLVSLVLLAFQNGFFWQQVLRHVRIET